ncbi:MAG: 16S rRNA (cytidine(1402)-2'-O)-methyltransferase [Pseudomonadota bacterium]
MLEDLHKISSGSNVSVLFIVATPIGNLEDITVRAINTLRSVNLIACEDTRTSRVLLNRHNISTPLISLHRFNENRKTRVILERLESGQSVALVSDAGTPNISDPGYRLVRSVVESGFRVVPIPGPSSVVAALSVSGVDGSSFVFLGFSPKKASALNNFFGQISQSDKTVIFLETARRIVKAMDVARKSIPLRRIALCRELTKKFEEILYGNSQSLYDELVQKENIKGEFVVVIEPAKQKLTGNVDNVISELIQEGLSGKSLAAEAQKKFGISRTLAYNKFLSMTTKDDSD